MRHSLQIKISYFTGLALLAFGALVCAGGLQAAPAKAKAKRAPAKVVRKSTASKAVAKQASAKAGRKSTVSKAVAKHASAKAGRKSTARRPGSKRRARVRRAVVTPATQKPNPLLVDVPPISWLVALQFPPMAPPPPVAGTCFNCSDPLLATAYSLLGVRYRSGGTSPESGFDCSGFTRYTYQTSLNVPLPSSAPAQFQAGVAVDKSELVPGDLVFFRPRKHGWHVGMYVGDDSFIHAPNRRRTVSVTPLSAPYWRSAYVGARRIPTAQTEDPAMVELNSNN